MNGPFPAAYLARAVSFGEGNRIRGRNILSHLRTIENLTLGLVRNSRLYLGQWVPVKSLQVPCADQTGSFKLTDQPRSSFWTGFV